MSFLKRILSWGSNPPEQMDENNRKYRLIQIITFEILLVGIVLACFTFYVQFWFIAAVLSAGILVALMNLILLKNNYNLLLCAHITNALCLTMIIMGNLWAGGFSVSYISWFYLPPVIAAVTIGLNGLLIYSMLSAIIMVFFITSGVTPIYLIPIEYLGVLNSINHLFIFLIIFTALYKLLTENKHYESLLKEQNFLLYSDKQKFHYLSHHDSLTNLPNRSYFHHHLESLLSSSGALKNEITLYFMDLDGFKKINDKYGHEIGDLLLLQTSMRLQKCFRENDIIARLGGDEFTAVITHGIHDKIAHTITERIEQEFKNPFLINNLKIKCTISVGKANYPNDALHSESLLKIADEAMYLTKKAKYKTNRHNL